MSRHVTYQDKSIQLWYAKFKTSEGEYLWKTGIRHLLPWPNFWQRYQLTHWVHRWKSPGVNHVWYWRVLCLCYFSVLFMANTMKLWRKWNWRSRCFVILYQYFLRHHKFPWGGLTKWNYFRAIYISHIQNYRFLALTEAEIVICPPEGGTDASWGVKR